jgi:hypothetical protein
MNHLPGGRWSICTPALPEVLTYYVLFSISKVTILDSKQKTLLKGSRDINTGLWRINLRQNEVQTRGDTARKQTQISEANNVYDLRNTGSLVNYLHRAMFSCTKSDLINSVKKGNLATWPGLTEEAIDTYLEMTPATAMGHMNQKRQNIHSTNKKVKSESEDEDNTPSGTGENPICFLW